MDKTDLLSEAICYKNEIITLKQFEAAVDRYSAALLQQTPCSTLREKILDKLTEAQKQQDEQTNTNRTWRAAQISTLSDVILLIDAQKPVA